MKKVIFITIIVMVYTLCLPLNLSYANSAEPPSILIFVPNAPEDLEVTIEEGNSLLVLREIKRTDKIIEAYYEIFLSDLKTYGDYTLSFETANDSFEIKLNKPLNRYNNIYTLNLENQTLAEGKLLARSIKLITMRVTLTIIVEAAVFYILGFRRKSSWIAFLIINFITQVALNIGINNYLPNQEYIIFGLVLAETLIFLFETVVFLRFVREHKKLIVTTYVITANMLSLVVGGYLITILPI